MKKRNLKKIGLVASLLGLVSVGLISCNDIAVMADAFDENSVIVPNAPDVGSQLLTYDLVNNYTSLPNWVRGNNYVMSYDEIFDAPFRFVYVAVRATGSYSGTTFSLSSVEFARLNWTSSTAIYNLPAYPYVVGFYDPTSSSLYAYESGSFPLYNFGGLSKFTHSASTIEGFYPSGCGLAMTHTFSSNTSGPYSWYLTAQNTNVFLDRLTPTISAFFNANDDYRMGYNAGYSAGSDAGRASGYQQGFAEGQESVTDSSIAVTTLFGAIASVPISILNGLSPLVIWNVPIISICISFLFIGLVLWIVKKFI